MSRGSKIFLGVLVAIFWGIFQMIWSTNIIQTLWNCDSTDYSPIIKKVAIPMQEELENFYSQTKRLPTMEDRDVLLRKVGCNIQGNVCIYGKERIKIITFIKSYNFRLELSMGNTGCLFGIQDDGNHDKVECDNSACISLKQ